MARIPEAQHRLFENVFICKKCKRKIRSDSNRVRNKQVKCRKCQGKSLRAVRLKK